MKVYWLYISEIAGFWVWGNLGSKGFLSIFVWSLSFVVAFYLEGGFDSGQLRGATGGAGEKEATVVYYWSQDSERGKEDL